MELFTIQLQEYEVKNILRMLKAGEIDKTVRRSTFAFMEVYNSNDVSKADDKVVKQLKFTKNNIIRQTNIKG